VVDQRCWVCDGHVEGDDADDDDDDDDASDSSRSSGQVLRSTSL
jgi:hypothetical protein